MSVSMLLAPAPTPVPGLVRLLPLPDKLGPNPDIDGAAIVIEHLKTTQTPLRNTNVNTLLANQYRLIPVTDKDVVPINIQLVEI